MSTIISANESRSKRDIHSQEKIASELGVDLISSREKAAGRSRTRHEQRLHVCAACH
jgi:hypothetical protein